MKKLTLILLSQALMQNIYTVNYYNQTILVTKALAKDFFLRDPGWHEVKRDADNSKNSRSHSALQITGFVQKLKKESKTGIYFSSNQHSAITTYGNNTAVDTSAMIHDVIPGDYQFYAYGNHYIFKRPIDVDSIDSNNFTGRNIGAVYEYDPLNTNHNYVKMTQDTTPSTPGFTPIEGPLDTKTNEARQANVETAIIDFDKNIAIPRMLTGQIQLIPKRTVWGTLVSYYSYFYPSKAWVQIDVPILFVKQSLTPKILGENRFIDSESNREVSMIDILAGNFDYQDSTLDNQNSQSALRFAKIKLKETQTTGLGDFSITFGYRLADNLAFDCDGYLEATFPTADEQPVEYLFQPQLGNNGHFCLGLGVKGSADLLSEQTYSLEAMFDFSTKYLFAKDQLRTFGSMTDAGVSLPWDRYMLVAKIGGEGPLVPLANISTLQTKVSPGLRSEGSFGLGLRAGEIVFNIGYSFCAKQSENLEIKSWENADLYGRPNETNYRADQIYDPTTSSFRDLDQSTISKKELFLQSGATPGSFSNTIFGQIGYYNINATVRSFSACTGFAYEFANENSSLSQYSLWIKLGTAF